MSAPLQPGATIAHYRLDSCLGQGGMGAFYLATDTRLDRPVALKILPEDLSSDPTRVGRFEREARVASALNHPHVAYIHEIGRHGDTWFLAMEYVEGEPLTARIATGPLPITDLLSLGIQLADALDAAHAKGILHPDLKPA